MGLDTTTFKLNLTIAQIESILNFAHQIDRSPSFALMGILVDVYPKLEMVRVFTSLSDFHSHGDSRSRKRDFQVTVTNAEYNWLMHRYEQQGLEFEKFLKSLIFHGVHFSEYRQPSPEPLEEEYPAAS